MLKCKMIHSYPREYYDLYQGFNANGGTIRQWVNEVETRSRGILNQDPEYNRIQLTDHLPNTWTATYQGDNWTATGPKSKEATQVMREIGATYNPATKEWGFTLKQVIDYVQKDTLYKFKGDMLEVLSEIFFTCFNSDEALGLREYAPVELTDDFGVDATGTNVNGHQCVVQVKYRSNPDDVIPYSDIARTFTSGVCQLGIMDIVNHPHTVYLFTTSNGTTAAYQKVMRNKTITVTRKIIATKIDNNANFWLFAFNAIKKTLE